MGDTRVRLWYHDRRGAQKHGRKLHRSGSFGGKQGHRYSHGVHRRCCPQPDRDRRYRKATHLDRAPPGVRATRVAPAGAYRERRVPDRLAVANHRQGCNRLRCPQPGDPRNAGSARPCRAGEYRSRGRATGRPERPRRRLPRSFSVSAPRMLSVRTTPAGANRRRRCRPTRPPSAKRCLPSHRRPSSTEPLPMGCRRRARRVLRTTFARRSLSSVSRRSRPRAMNTTSTDPRSQCPSSAAGVGLPRQSS